MPSPNNPIGPHSTQADMGEILRSLGELTGKVDAVLASVQAQKGVSDKHEDRISSLERWRAYMIGAAVASGGVAGLAVEKFLSP